VNIGAVARQTGIEVATLRKWELRYGFPLPLRSATGRREYSAETVTQLLAIRRSMADGLRTSKAIKAYVSRDEQVLTQCGDTTTSRGISLLLRSDTLSLRQWLSEQRQQMNAVDFVEQIAAPMAREVGGLWASGRLPVFAEHLLSEELQRVLRSAHQKDRTVVAQPRILLTAPAGERHTLGLLMAGAVLTAQGEIPLYLPADLPVSEITAAAIHYQVTVVGVTASINYPSKLLIAILRELRDELPPSIQLWAGGAGIAHLPKLPEQTIQISNMATLLTCLQSLPGHTNAMTDEPRRCGCIQLKNTRHESIT